MHTVVERIWTQQPSSLQFVQWDLGSELWELNSGSDVRHFGVLERQIQADGSVQEVLEVLPEAPVPLEALAFHEIQGQWTISERTISKEKVGKLDKEPVQQQPLRQERRQERSPKVREKKQPAKSPSSGDRKTSHEQLKSQDEEFQATECSQLPSTLPTELWSSLSQWIPSDVLFQPSLHQQARQELSDTQAPSSPFPKAPQRSSQQKRAPHPSGGQAQQSRPSRPKTSSRVR